MKNECAREIVGAAGEDGDALDERMHGLRGRFFVAREGGKNRELSGQ
jgi:hypothetical protein